VVPDVTGLRSGLDTIRSEGIALDAEKHRGVFAVGAPVFDAAGRMTAAMTVVASYDRTDDAERDLCSAAVRQVARELSRDLGYAEAR